MEKARQQQIANTDPNALQTEGRGVRSLTESAKTLSTDADGTAAIATIPSSGGGATSTTDGDDFGDDFGDDVGSLFE